MMRRTTSGAMRWALVALIVALVGPASPNAAFGRDLPGGGGARGGGGGGIGRGAGGGGRLDPNRGRNVRNRRERKRFLDRVSPPSNRATSARPPSAPTPTPRPRRPGAPGAPGAGGTPFPPASTAPSVVHLRKGSVRLIADLARVHYSLSVRNVGTTTIEWRRSYAIDPAAQVIGAVLHRPGILPVRARTLTLADARRIYGEARTPRRPRNRPRPQTRNKDPLRLERVRRSQLDVIVWPIAPNETIRVELTFVAPLRGRGSSRTYVDIIESAELSGQRTPVGLDEAAPEENVDVNEGGITTGAELLVNPGDLKFAALPVGLELTGMHDGVLRFVPRIDVPRRPTIHFRKPLLTEQARMVKGGGLHKHVAIWRMDPISFLDDRGFMNRAGLSIRIVPKTHGMARIAPNTFLGTDDPRPITAVLRAPVTSLEFAVEVLNDRGEVVDTFDQRLATRTMSYDRDLVGAITGWHRAMLVERVFDWARTAKTSADPRAEAIAFAVDMGVLRPGTAALAVPPRERARLSHSSVRMYDNDGVPLGAQRREADMRAPPDHSLDD